MSTDKLRTCTCRAFRNDPHSTYWLSTLIRRRRGGGAYDNGGGWREGEKAWETSWAASDTAPKVWTSGSWPTMHMTKSMTMGQLPKVQTFSAVLLAAQLVSHAFSPSLQPPPSFVNLPHTHSPLLDYILDSKVSLVVSKFGSVWFLTTFSWTLNRTMGLDWMVTGSGSVLVQTCSNHFHNEGPSFLGNLAPKAEKIQCSSPHSWLHNLWQHLSAWWALQTGFVTPADSVGLFPHPWHEPWLWVGR